MYDHRFGKNLSADVEGNVMGFFAPPAAPKIWLTRPVARQQPSRKEVRKTM